MKRSLTLAVALLMGLCLASTASAFNGFGIRGGFGINCDRNFDGIPDRFQTRGFGHRGFYGGGFRDNFFVREREFKGGVDVDVFDRRGRQLLDIDVFDRGGFHRRCVPIGSGFLRGRF